MRKGARANEAVEVHTFEITRPVKDFAEGAGVVRTSVPRSIKEKPVMRGINIGWYKPKPYIVNMRESQDVGLFCPTIYILANCAPQIAVVG